MNRDELQEFISNKVYYTVPSSTVKQMMADTRTMDIKSFKDKWNDTLEESSEGWKEFIGENGKKSVAERISSAFGSDDKKNPFRRSDNYIDEIYEKQFKGDVPREQFDATLGNMAQYWDDEKSASEYEAGKIRRENEVKNWPWSRKLLASDYEQARYINEPEKALFGDEAPDIGKAKDTRWGSMGDLGAGVVGGTLELAPGMWGYAGPTVRALRDVAHIASGSKYQKTPGEIAQSFAADAMMTAPIAHLPNFRRGQRMLGNIGGANLHGIIDIEADAAKNAAAADAMQAALNGGSVGKALNTDLRKAWTELPPSPLKDQLKSVVMVPNPRLHEIDQITKQAKSDASLAASAEGRNMVRTGEAAVGPVEYTPMQQRIVETPELTKTQRTFKPVVKFTDKVLGGEIGGAVLKGTKTATKLGATTPTANDVDWYIANYARDWDRDIGGFKPSKADQKDGNPKWEAYKQYYFNKYGEMPTAD